MLPSERQGINDATEQFNNKANENLQSYKNDINENSGITGYQTALNQAKGTAANTAQNAANQSTAQAQAAAQQSGMSKAAAAMNAANNAANQYTQQYGSTLANQQNIIGGYQQSKLNQSSNLYSKQLDNAKMIYQQKLAEYQDKIDRRNQLYNMIAHFAMSGVGAGAVQSGMDWLTAQAAARRNNAARGALSDANATITSDENSKKSNIDNFLDHLQAYAFEYKDKDAEDSEQHVGITAQDVQETRPDMVEEHNGQLEINRNKLIETVAAGLAELRKEFK
jgi:hypothetical protein